MPDDPKQAGSPDDARINVEQDHELRYWTEEFGVTREELRAAVRGAGPLVKNVRARLGANRYF